MILKTKKIKIFGNKDFTIQSLSPDKSEYVNDALTIQGLVDLSMDVSQTENIFEADDNPEYIVTRTPPIAEGTANIRGIENKYIPKIYPAVGGEGRGIRIGEDLPEKYFGFMVKEQVEVEGIKSENLYVFYTCRATSLPSLATASVSNAGVTPRGLPLGLRCIPTEYKKADGSNGRVLYDIFNSVDDKYDFDRFKDGIVMPVDITEAKPI